MMGGNFELTPGMQCCLRCGRVLTDRALHDLIEDSVLQAISVRHPEWVAADEECRPCVDEYRRLLNDRQTRFERLREESKTRWPLWVSRMFGKTRGESHLAPLR
ncbi:MAG: hypothetical protein H0V27_01960 [Pyrinomonadaceae bacterium]|nr:hypothetical protein [Pyrinomonadaceae bacterium]